MKILFIFFVLQTSLVLGQKVDVPSKFDEITNVPHYYCPDCEPKVQDRIERFAAYLQKSGRAKQVFIVHYRARILEEDNKHRLGNWTNSAKWQISNTLIGHDNIFTIDGGIREFDTLEFWIAPKGSPTPSLTPKYSRDEAINCPSIYVFQEGMAFERTIIFNTSIRPTGNYSYEWAVDKGKIEGSNIGDSVKVSLADFAGDRTTAFLKVSGVPIPCKNSFTAIGEAGNTPKLVDEFGKIADGEFKARMDNFFIHLSNYSAMRGYVYFYGDRKLASKDIRGNKARLVRYAAVRRYDQNRFTIIEAGFKEEQTTEFWLVPPDVPAPKPSPSVDGRFIKLSPRK